MPYLWKAWPPLDDMLAQGQHHRWAVMADATEKERMMTARAPLQHEQCVAGERTHTAYGDMIRVLHQRLPALGQERAAASECRILQLDSFRAHFDVRIKDLCMERATNIFVHLRPCDASEVKQLWVGFRQDQPFDLRPLQQNLRPSQYNDPVEVHRCISQDHHPKKYEIIFLEECEKAHFWDTALWEAI